MFHPQNRKMGQLLAVQETFLEKSTAESNLEQVDIYLPFFPICLQFIHSLMYGQVTSRNHQAYS